MRRKNKHISHGHAMILLMLCITVLGCIITPTMSDPFINGQVYTGSVTYYTEWKSGLGSCGIPLPIDKYLCALSKKFMSSTSAAGGGDYSQNPNSHPLCGQKYCVKIDGPSGSIVVKVTDTCAGCADYDVDVADEVFSSLAPMSAGRVQMKWQFVDCATNPPGPATSGGGSKDNGGESSSKPSKNKENPNKGQSKGKPKRKPKAAKKKKTKKSSAGSKLGKFVDELHIPTKLSDILPGSKSATAASSEAPSAEKPLTDPIVPTKKQQASIDDKHDGATATDQKDLRDILKIPTINNLYNDLIDEINKGMVEIGRKFLEIKKQHTVIQVVSPTGPQVTVTATATATATTTASFSISPMNQKYQNPEKKPTKASDDDAQPDANSVTDDNQEENNNPDENDPTLDDDVAPVIKKSSKKICECEVSAKLKQSYSPRPSTKRGKDKETAGESPIPPSSTKRKLFNGRKLGRKKGKKDQLN